MFDCAGIGQYIFHSIHFVAVRMLVPMLLLLLLLFFFHILSTLYQVPSRDIGRQFIPNGLINMGLHFPHVICLLPFVWFLFLLVDFVFVDDQICCCFDSITVGCDQVNSKIMFFCLILNIHMISSNLTSFLPQRPFPFIQRFYVRHKVNISSICFVLLFDLRIEISAWAIHLLNMA